jgi:membrane carboxypeptidase/penicillin-binding protein
MTAAEEGTNPLAFVPPEKVVARRIDAATGLLAPTGTAAEGYEGKTLEEFFVKGTEPIEEAVPAAMEAGDVVLGLYDEAPVEDETVVEELVPQGEQSDPKVPPQAPVRDEPGTSARELPSLGD